MPRVRRAAGVGRLADEARLLADEPVVGALMPATGVHVLAAGAVHHHRHVDVVERAEADHLALAAEELGLARRRSPAR